MERRELLAFIESYQADRHNLSKMEFYELNERLLRLALNGIGVLNYENYEISGEAHFLKHFLQGQERPLVLDVGAHHGGYSRLAKEVNESARIHAFEPHPDSYAILEKTARDCNFQAHSFGLSDVEGIVALYDYSDSRKTHHASMYKEVIETMHESASKSYRVSMKTLDCFLQSEAIEKVDLLKIDAEGRELHILLGAKNAIAKNTFRTIQFEFNEMNVCSRSFFKDFYALLPDYAFFRMLSDGLVPLGEYGKPLLFELFAFQNIVAVQQKA